jgi:tetratricopeptide (TPR) repeat protein
MNSNFQLQLGYVLNILCYFSDTRVEKILPKLNLGIDLSLTPKAQFQALYQLIIRIADRVLEIDPEDVDALYLQLEVLKKLNHLKELETSCYKLLQIDPNHIMTYNMLGVIYQKRQRWSESIKFFKMALSIDPNFLGANVSLNISYAENNKTYNILCSLEKA